MATPPHVGERLAAFYGRDGRLTDAREWADTIAAAVRAETGWAPEESDMCTAADGPHAVEFAADSRSYGCVLDPLVAVFPRGRPGMVRSETPAGREVAIETGTERATATPASAVVSLGVGDTGREPTLEAAYGQLCAYTRVFTSSEAYERWDAEAEAGTTSLSVGEAVALARELVDAPG